MQSGQDHAVDDRHQGLGTSVGDHLRVDLATALEDTEDRNLASGTTAMLPFPLATEGAFIRFNLAGKWRDFIQPP